MHTLGQTGEGPQVPDYEPQDPPACRADVQIFDVGFEKRTARAADGNLLVAVANMTLSLHYFGNLL
jgi:hypothetical protein